MHTLEATLDVMELTRRRYRLFGVVQGVGFRPHVAQVAQKFPVTGFCGNNDREVFIEVQGTLSDVEAFYAELLETLPALATVVRADVDKQDPREEAGFRIVPSEHVPGARTLLPPDVATCADCLADMSDPANRRYRYPFTTCTNCGPRLSIIQGLPYDRPLTTMRDFPMCPACQAEYEDPRDRRFHAQPISCPDCGPRLWTSPESEDVFHAVRMALDAGQIIAVRGIGGFHLLCDAQSPSALRTLRERKNRPGKPLAIMAPTLESARTLAVFSQEEEELLLSPARPIVIAPSRGVLPEEVAPGLSDVGIMLPYSPLHHLLVDRPVAATSGNVAGEPLCFSNDQALEKLGGIADLFVLHDREIHVPVEDSVFIGSTPARRSRGYAPVPIPLPPGPSVLAVGGELKNTFTLAHEDYAHVSAHIGDMGSLATQEAFERAVEQLLSMRRGAPELVVCDLHPGYSTSSWAARFAERHGLDLVEVQHHHAHALSLLAEHGIFQGPAVVATLDGTGFGLDGTIWGGELLTLSPTLDQAARTWHLPDFPLVGGDRAVTHPWRSALGVAAAYGLDWSPPGAPAAEVELVRSQLSSGIGTVSTSSTGRLFDAAAAFLGVVPGAITFEAQAAMSLEGLASTGAYPDRIPDSIPALMAALLDASLTPADRARLFHAGLARLVGGELLRAADDAGTEVIGLTGGCALNRILVADLQAVIEGTGHRLLLHEKVPANDGGLSLGQALAGRLAVGLTDSRQWVADELVHHPSAAEGGEEHDGGFRFRRDPSHQARLRGARCLQCG
ncbi:carbamoyltransferase HypF [Corynebacterium atrinae]